MLYEPHLYMSVFHYVLTHMHIQQYINFVYVAMVDIAYNMQAVYTLPGLFITVTGKCI